MMFQAGATLLDACVLSVLHGKDFYGYSLTQALRESLDISESTLYPVLRRLQKEECLTAYDEPYQGRNRRYYTITDRGRAQVEEYRRAWQDFRARVDSLILGGAAS